MSKRPNVIQVYNGTHRMTPVEQPGGVKAAARGVEYCPRAHGEPAEAHERRIGNGLGSARLDGEQAGRCGTGTCADDGNDAARRDDSRPVCRTSDRGYDSSVQVCRTLARAGMMEVMLLARRSFCRNQ